MAALHMKVTTAKMPHTSEFFAVVKAVERFYYALLFSTCAAYVGRPEPWRSWVEQGFSAAIRQPPPETRELDALATSVRSAGKVIEVTAESVNERLLVEVGRLLYSIDAGKSELQKRLLEPVSAGLRSSGVDKRTSERITDVLCAGIDALNYRDIVSIEQSVSVGDSPPVSGAVL